jgi:pimeloyl-ACP methyl ester carboxylesterase
MATVRVNGVTLSYEEAGEGPPLRFLPAFPVARRMWAPQVPFFGGRYRAIVDDDRGFGRSEAPKEPTAIIAAETTRA